MNEVSGSECTEMLAGISAYLDGDLDSTACEAIERHCTVCARCRSIVQGLRETIGLCREAGHAPIPESVRDRARASIQRLLTADEDA